LPEGLAEKPGLSDPESLAAVITAEISRGGPITFARYMELALYHHRFGYYTRAVQRSGQTGDFFTSVDVGPVFGELLARQFEEMWRLMRQAQTAGDSVGSLQLIEAGAGNGRLARDVLDAAAVHHPAFYDSVELHLTEASATARASHVEQLGPHAGLLASSSAELPRSIEGVLYANELLDALPFHRVEQTTHGLREVHVDFAEGRFFEALLPPSTPRLEEHFERLGVSMERGWRAEVGLAAVDWMREAARRLRRGFVLLVDYGHTAETLYSERHSGGTLATFSRHVIETEPTGGHTSPPWLLDPGSRDMTAHVDLTSITKAAEEEGLERLAALDQMYFLLGLGLAELASQSSGRSLAETKRRLALKTLVMPGGLGTTHKVLVFGRGVGRPALRGCSYGGRLT
jgi:SAM-dependent MidA family methyltransferase